MNLSEKQAKEVLNFLTRKIGYDNIDVIKSRLKHKHNKLYFIMCGFLDKHMHHVLCDAYLMPIYACSSSYAKILEYLFEMSKAGKDIWCGSIDRKEKLFLHAYTSLEEILIEMDLNLKTF